VDWKSDLIVDYNKILRFTGFVANDLCGYVTIFWCLFFRIFSFVNPIKKVFCNQYLDNEWLIAKSL
jgi:hypothetical protein